MLLVLGYEKVALSTGSPISNFLLEHPTRADNALGLKFSLKLLEMAAKSSLYDGMDLCCTSFITLACHKRKDILVAVEPW